MRSPRIDTETLFISGHYRAARRRYLAALKTEPSSHWLLTRIGATYYEERNYLQALEWNSKAMEVMPRCPLVLWDRAGALSMLDQDPAAQRIWRRFISLGVDGLLDGPCAEGRPWARALVTDSMAALGRSYVLQHRFVLARRFLTQSLTERTRGDPQVWSVRDVKQYLARCAGASPKPHTRPRRAAGHGARP